jgi:hypothetical protein
VRGSFQSGRTIRVALIALACTLAVACSNSNLRPQLDKPCIDHARSVAVTDFGARGDGVGDNAQAFRQAIAYASRCSISVISVPAGTYGFIPQGAEAGIYLASHLSLRGAGRSSTMLVVLAGRPKSNFASLFWARDQDDISFADLSFMGNNEPMHDGSGRPLNTYGSAITIVLDAGPGAPQSGKLRNLAHFTVSNCSFRNFNAAAWISVMDYNATLRIDDVRIIDNEFVSYQDNAVNPSSIGYVSNAISIMGSMTSAGGLVTDTLISGNSIDARYIKGGIAIWSGVRGAKVERNRIVDAGAAPYIPNNSGAYAINVYNNAYYYHDTVHADGAPMGGSRPDDVHIRSNVILRPRSCGVYAASAGRLWIEDNVISGQSDSEDQLLPKGAIALNQPDEAVVTGNMISSSLVGLALYPGKHGNIRSANNTIK